MQSPSLNKCEVPGIVLIAFLLISTISPLTANSSPVPPGKSLAKQPLIVFLITEDSLNYEAHRTIPVFAEKIRKEFGYDVAVLLGSGPHGACRFPDIHKIDDAALLVVFQGVLHYRMIRWESLRTISKKENHSSE